MLSAADRTRLGHIEQEQEQLIRRLIELRREENTILQRVEWRPPEPTKVGTAKPRRYEPAGRSAYFQKGRR